VPEPTSPRAAARIAAIVVTHESEEVLGPCLASLRGAAPAAGLAVLVVDNASRDASAALAARELGEAQVLRLAENRGFAAGVNAGLAAVEAPWVAGLNPDTVLPEGALDRLAAVLESHPRAALVGPRVLDGGGGLEETVGRFPTLARERAHTWWLDRLLGIEGRRAPFPAATAVVDWVSGCAWLLRAAALRTAGPLDEGYFMYYEDVDYCRRLHDAGFEVLATPEVTLRHLRGHGSAASGLVAADGGASLVRYFRKFHPEVPRGAVRGLLLTGWRLRRVSRRLRAALGDGASRAVARRYERAIAELERG